MLVRIGKLFLILALVAMLGAHWAALQTVAWTTMLANNLRTQSVSQAVSDTFDGRHLCPMCRAIAAAKKTEKKSEAVAPAFKMEFPPTAGKLALASPAHHHFLPLTDSFAQSLTHPPLTPPPRNLPA